MPARKYPRQEVPKFDVNEAQKGDNLISIIEERQIEDEIKEKDYKIPNYYDDGQNVADTLLNFNRKLGNEKPHTLPEAL